MPGGALSWLLAAIVVVLIVAVLFRGRSGMREGAGARAATYRTSANAGHGGGARPRPGYPGPGAAQMGGGAPGWGWEAPRGSSGFVGPPPAVPGESPSPAIAETGPAEQLWTDDALRANMEPLSSGRPSSGPWGDVPVPGTGSYSDKAAAMLSTSREAPDIRQTAQRMMTGSALRYQDAEGFGDYDPMAGRAPPRSPVRAEPGPCRRGAPPAWAVDHAAEDAARLAAADSPAGEMNGLVYDGDPMEHVGDSPGELLDVATTCIDPVYSGHTKRGRPPRCGRDAGYAGTRDDRPDRKSAQF
jgi:hypothetical protein